MNPRIGFRCPYCDRLIRVSRDVGSARIRWDLADWSKPDRTLARQMRVSESHVSQQRRKYAQHTVGVVRKSRGNRDWRNVDWMRSTSAIAAEMKVTKGAVSSMRRKRAPQTMAKQK
jgi:hypothetical protein